MVIVVVVFLVLNAYVSGIVISVGVASQAVENMMKEISATYPNQAAFRQALAEAGYGTPEEYRRLMTTTFKRSRAIDQFINQLRQDKKLPAVVVPESAVHAQYERLKAAGQLTRRASTVSFRQMVIAPRPSPAAKEVARRKADSLREEIRAGGDFERIAKRESMDAATKEQGGDLGWRKRGDLPAELERYLFGPLAIKQGEVSPVIESPFGFHLLRLDRANPPAEVKVRQILIIPAVDSTDVTRARQLSDSLVDVLRRGVSFDTIARLFHDPAEDAPGLIPEMPFDSLPVTYQAGLRDVKKDSIVAFPIPAPLGYSKYVIAEVASTSEPGDYTYDELKARIRAQLQAVLQTRKYIDQARATVFVQTHPERAQEAVRVFDGRPGQ
jgi:peptidyl-prolyl cis-trans isomerase SurA